MESPQIKNKTVTFKNEIAKQLSESGIPQAVLPQFRIQHCCCWDFYRIFLQAVQINLKVKGSNKHIQCFLKMCKGQIVEGFPFFYMYIPYSKDTFHGRALFCMLVTWFWISQFYRNWPSSQKFGAKLSKSSQPHNMICVSYRRRYTPPVQQQMEDSYIKILKLQECCNIAVAPCHLSGKNSRGSGNLNDLVE